MGLILLVGGVEAGEGTKIIINKQTNQLAFYQGGQLTRVLAVATGKKPEYTPEGNFKVVKKLVNPYYSRGRIKGGSPRNPLGARWLGLSVGKTGGSVYGIHGNNKPSSIGTYASAGCVRMYNQEVIWLYDRVPIGTAVEIMKGSWDLPVGIYGVVENKISVLINGQPLKLAPGEDLFSIGGLTMAPVTSLVGALGGEVTFDKKTNTLTMDVNKTRITARPGSSQGLIGERKQEVKPAPFYRRNTIYMPLRWLIEGFGAKVTWDSMRKAAIIDNLSEEEQVLPVVEGQYN
ncbi:MAG: L,D-transpeptidase family protein [Clostridia bacterium]|nr:L,D-transpeptidase family protein [Clostridia bacterium]